MADFTLFTEITGDASGLVAALKEANSSLSEFGASVGTIASGVALGNFLTMAAEKVASFTDSIVSSAAEFQTLTTSLSVLGQNMTGFVNTASDDMGGMSGKTAITAEEIQDTMMLHKERLQKINDDIAIVMQGQNIIDAQNKLNNELVSLQETHTDKVTSLQQQVTDAFSSEKDREEQRQQSEIDALQNMTDSHNNQVADKTERFQLTLNNARSNAEKKYLQQKFDEQMKVDQDTFQRSYDLKKKQEDKRIAEENARDQKQTKEKSARLQKQINEENEQYDKQKAKLQKDTDERLDTYEKENSKKLALYQQELGNEERAYKLHMDKLNEASSGAVSPDTRVPGFASANDPFMATKQTMKDLLPMMLEFADKSPFKEDDVLRAGKSLSILGANAREVLPILGNIAGGLGMPISQAVDIMDTAMVRGRRGFMTMGLQMGISQQQLDGFGAAFDKQGKVIDQGSFWQAIAKVSNTKFAGGMDAQAKTLTGSMIILMNNLDEFGRQFLDISDNGTVKKGGLFDEIQKGVQLLLSFLSEHGDQIKNIIMTIGTVILSVAGYIGTVFTGAVKVFNSILEPLKPSIGDLSNHFVKLLKDLEPVFNFINKYIAPVLQFLAQVIGFLVIKQIESFIGALDQLVTKADALINAFSKVGDFFKNLFRDIGKQAEDVGKKIINSHLNPFAKGSPSLIETVNDGLGIIKEKYLSFGNFNISMPSMVPAQTSQINNYNNTQHSPQVTMNNTFNVQNQANASSVAEYLAFLASHRGIV